MFTLNLLKPKLAPPSRVALAMQVGVLACATLIPALRPSGSVRSLGGQHEPTGITTATSAQLLVDTRTRTSRAISVAIVAWTADTSSSPTRSDSDPPCGWSGWRGHSFTPGTFPAAAASWRGPPARS